jgi:hypothetical protein
MLRILFFLFFYCRLEFLQKTHVVVNGTELPFGLNPSEVGMERLHKLKTKENEDLWIHNHLS